MTQSEILNDFRNVVSAWPFHRYDAYFSVAADRYGDQMPPKSDLIEVVLGTRGILNLKTTKRSVVNAAGEKITLRKKIRCPDLRRCIVKPAQLPLPLEQVALSAEQPIRKTVTVQNVQQFNGIDGTVRLILDIKAA